MYQNTRNAVLIQWLVLKESALPETGNCEDNRWATRDTVVTQQKAILPMKESVLAETGMRCIKTTHHYFVPKGSVIDFCLSAALQYRHTFH